VSRTISRVGLISDTHGHLDSRVHQALEGVDAIIHAGDVGGDAVLYELQTIARRLTAVRGNCDAGGDAWGLEPVARVTIEGVRFLVIHDIGHVASVPEDVDVIVFGHSHRPAVLRHGHALAINPGSASQRRSMPSRSVAIVHIADDGSIETRSVMLDDIAPPR